MSAGPTPLADWRELSREPLVSTPWMRVDRERVATPTRPGGVEWTIVRRPSAVVIAPRTPEGEFLLVRQERVPVRREFWEFPAGQIDGPPTPEEILATAHRELAEETGCRAAGGLTPLGIFYSSVGFTDERAHLFLAEGVVPTGAGHAPGEGEAITGCRAFSVGELRAAVTSGEICDANTLSTFARLVVHGHI